MATDNVSVLGVGAANEGHRQVLELAATLSKAIADLTRLVKELSDEGALSQQRQASAIGLLQNLIQQQSALALKMMEHANGQNEQHTDGPGAQCI